MVNPSFDLMNQNLEKVQENKDMLIDKMRKVIILALNLQEVSNKSNKIINAFLTELFSYWYTDENLEYIINNIWQGSLWNILKYKFVEYLYTKSKNIENVDNIESFLSENFMTGILKNFEEAHNKRFSDSLENNEIITDDRFTSLCKTESWRYIIYKNIACFLSVGLNEENQKKLSGIIDEYMRRDPKVLDDLNVINQIALPF